ncbi:MAG: tetratricopeptide repeat protein [Nitrospiraceae bacterium]|nr:tetratricopeptide repeat protein [Nitrospiraceae bacterium]
MSTRLRSALLALCGTLAAVQPSIADPLSNRSEAQVLEEAKAIWDSGSPSRALDLLDEGLQDHPNALMLHKLRGDILTASRRPKDAVRAYDSALAEQPSALNARWAKWSTLLRWGQQADAAAELQRIADIDHQNPLTHLRLAQELRRLDRLEESLESYQKAVDLVPDVLSWRLAMARARFDVLDIEGADRDVRHVLQHVPPGSPLESPARNLLAVLYGPERGRRFIRSFAADGTPAQRKEWAAIRADAWNLFSIGRFAEAEPIYRRILALNPMDANAVHQLGLSLMKLGRCSEAITVFRSVANLEIGDEEYADTVFRMGQCLVELQRWEDAFVHFQILYDAAVEFETNNKNIDLPPGMRVLSKDKLGEWLAKVKPHVPDADSMVAKEQPFAKTVSEDELYAKIAAMRLTHKPLETRASLMGRDSDFSWFRYVIPATKVLRDDFPTGAHDFVPINPSDTFPAAQSEIFLVFGLVSDSYDAVPLSTSCYLERSETTGEQQPAAQDRVVMAMSDQSGYFRLSRPQGGWLPGLYRCGLFEGEYTSAYDQVDETRFRIVMQDQSS